MVAISQTVFSVAFSWMKSFVFFIKIPLKFVPKGPINNDPGLDNGLALKRRQAIILNNADPIHWCTYAALGGDELNRLISHLIL